MNAVLVILQVRGYAWEVFFMIIIAYQSIQVEKTAFGGYFQGSRQMVRNTLHSSQCRRNHWRLDDVRQITIGISMQTPRQGGELHRNSLNIQIPEKFEIFFKKSFRSF